MSDRQPVVSIITPFYNPGKVLKGAIESIQSQSFAEWELLLVDDGSNDGSRAAAEDAARRDCERILLLSHADGKNHGLTVTRNLGLQHCRGEFVALLDADDVWLPSKLQEQVEILRHQADAAMVFGRSEYWHSWDAGAKETDSVPELPPGERMYAPPELWKLCYPFGRFGTPCPSDLMFRRTALERVGGFEECFDERSPTHEDIALLSKIFLSFPVYVSTRCWDRYRRHDGSIWSIAQRNGGEERSRAFYFEWMRGYLEKSGIRDEEIWQMLEQRSWRYRHSTVAAWLDMGRSALRPIKRLLRS
ncbi:MAG TPA: glycosyltransferase [Terriglobales bacterium]